MLKLRIQRRLFFIFPHWFDPAAVCAWCAIRFRKGGWLSKRKVSHGLCEACKQKGVA